MSLRTIVETLGGDLYDRGRRANIPAPGHSAQDRSVSLLLENGRVIVHTFGDGDWRGVLDDLRARRLIDARNAPMSVTGAPRGEASAVRSASDRRAAALRIWDGSREVTGSVAELYARRRGVVRALPGAEVLRHHPTAPVSAYRSGGPVRPALLVAIRAADGDLTAVEVTYLTPGGLRAHDLRLARKTIGLAPGGCAVRLDPPAAQMLVAEGVFTALSAGARFALPCWALTSTRNLRVWSPPEDVRQVLIAADRGKDGEASAELLARRLVDGGVSARIALPPEPWGDWNEWACGTGGAAGPG